jgi:hypothetical protein
MQENEFDTPGPPKKFDDEFPKYSSEHIDEVDDCQSGDKITVTADSYRNGNEHDNYMANTYLKIGEIYTVSKIVKGDFLCWIWVKEVDGKRFKTFQFVKYEPNREPVNSEQGVHDVQHESESGPGMGAIEDRDGAGRGEAEGQL